MVTTQPKFDVNFKEEAVVAIQRQERKQVLLVVKESPSYEATQASAGYFTTPAITENVDNFKSLTSGSITIIVDDIEHTVTDLDFSDVNDLSDIADVLAKAVIYADVEVVDNEKLKFTSLTTGSASTVEIKEIGEDGDLYGADYLNVANGVKTDGTDGTETLPNKSVTYRTLGEVAKDDYTAKNYQYITLAFLGNPSKVTVLTTYGDGFSSVQDDLKTYSNYILAYPAGTEADHTTIINYIKQRREEKNDYSFAILGNATAPDQNFIVNFTTSDIVAKINGEEVALTAGEYTARVAGALGGLAETRSLTYYELSELISCTLFEDEDAPVVKGQLIILHQDGSYRFGRAVNSLVTLTDGVTEAFQKIRVCTIMDEIANDIVTTFRTQYVGKLQNNYANKCRFCGAINAYLNDCADEGLLEAENDNKVQISYSKTKSYIEGKGVDTSNMSYIEIIKYNTGSNVFLEGAISPTDTMEDLDITMFLFQALETEES